VTQDHSLKQNQGAKGLVLQEILLEMSPPGILMQEIKRVAY